MDFDHLRHTSKYFEALPKSIVHSPNRRSKTNGDEASHLFPCNSFSFRAILTGLHVQWWWCHQTRSHQEILDVMEHIGKWHYLMGRSKYIAWYVHMLQHWPYVSQKISMWSKLWGRIYFNFLPNSAGILLIPHHQYGRNNTCTIWHLWHEPWEWLAYYYPGSQEDMSTVVGSESKEQTDYDNNQLRSCQNLSLAWTQCCETWSSSSAIPPEVHSMQWGVAELARKIAIPTHCPNTGQGVTGEIPPWPQHCCS